MRSGLGGLLATMNESMEPPKDVFKTKQKSWYKVQSSDETKKDATKDNNMNTKTNLPLKTLLDDLKNLGK